MIGYENSKIPRLFEIMEQRKIKAKDITAAIGISSGLISDWKSGKSAPSGNRLMDLANYLNVSVEYLLGSDSEENALDTKIQAESKQLTDDQKADVLKYIEFIKSK
jgi:transcriptional regulator with XRE-family HTH domain